jgi:hypothetical protein
MNILPHGIYPDLERRTSHEFELNQCTCPAQDIEELCTTQGAIFYGSQKEVFHGRDAGNNLFRESCVLGRTIRTPHSE